jgi:hypothetical protein
LLDVKYDNNFINGFKCINDGPIYITGGTMKIQRYYTRTTTGLKVNFSGGVDRERDTLLDLEPIEVANQEAAYNKCLEYLTQMKTRSLFSPDQHQIHRIESGYEAIRGKRREASDISISDVVVFKVTSA